MESQKKLAIFAKSTRISKVLDAYLNTSGCYSLVDVFRKHGFRSYAENNDFIVVWATFQDPISLIEKISGTIESEIHEISHELELKVSYRKLLKDTTHIQVRGFDNGELQIVQYN